MASIAFPIFGLTGRLDEITTVKIPRDISSLTPSKVTFLGNLSTRSKNYVDANLLIEWPHQPLPSWLVGSVDQIKALLALPENWDHSGSPPISKRYILSSLQSLSEIATSTMSVPQWTPAQGGGIQLEWHESGVDLEIVFDPQYWDGYVVFTDQEDASAEWDLPLPLNLDRVRSVIEGRLNARR